MKKRRRSWNYINPINRPPKKLGFLIAFDIETKQKNINEKISSYLVKQKSKLWFGTACVFVSKDVIEKKKILQVPSRLGFEPQVEDYFLVDELYFEDRETFTKWVLDYAKRVGNIYVFAHNISFDIREAVDFDILRKAGFDITVFNPQPKQFIIKFVKRKGKRKYSITFTDTLNLYPASLEEVGRTIGMEKLAKKFGLDRANLDRYDFETVLKYNVRDTQITASAVIIREKIVNELGGQLRLTNPSTAMDLFRRKFLKYGIKKPPKILRDYIRKAYFGGRTEVFFRGVVSSKNFADSAEKIYRLKKGKLKQYGFHLVDGISYVDVNSLYPYSMKYFPSPIEIIGQYSQDGVEVLKKLLDLGILIEFDPLHPLESIYHAWKRQLLWLPKQFPDKDWEGIARKLEALRYSDELLSLREHFMKPVLYIVEATVHVKKGAVRRSITPLPVKKDGKLIFPEGTFRGVWTQFELSLFRQIPDLQVLEIHNILLFKADWLFIEYVDTFYRLKSEAKKKGDAVTYQVAKLFMNSLYGKWAEHKRTSVMMTKEEFGEFILEKLSEMKGNASLEIAYDLDYGVIRVDGMQINAIGGYFEVKTREYSEPYNVAISTFITSVARSVLREYIYLVKKKGGEVYYCDTDSLIVDLRGLEALKPYIDKYRLGYLDEEISNIAFVEINTLKDYKVYVPREAEGEERGRIGYIRKLVTKVKDREKVSYYYFDENKHFWVKYKLKGVSLSRARVLSEDDDSTFAVERLVGVREFLKYGTFGLYWIEQTKELKRTYDKAASADGWVVPHYFGP